MKVFIIVIVLLVILLPISGYLFTQYHIYECKKIGYKDYNWFADTCVYNGKDIGLPVHIEVPYDDRYNFKKYAKEYFEQYFGTFLESL